MRAHWLVVVAVVMASNVLTACGDRQTRHQSEQRPVPASNARWSTRRAEQRLTAVPPLAWRIRTWQVVSAECVGQGQRTGRPLAFRNFGCAITIVRPSHDCPSAGRYECVAGFESTVITRTLHVVSATRYALYRS
jgi:hypothetical protein